MKMKLADTSTLLICLAFLIGLLLGALIVFLIMRRKKQVPEVPGAHRLPAETVATESSREATSSEESDTGLSTLPAVQPVVVPNEYLAAVRQLESKLNTLLADLPPGDELSIAGELRRTLEPSPEGQTGFLDFLQPWCGLAERNELTRQHLLKDIARSTFRKRIVKLYRLRGVIAITPIREIYRERAIPTAPLIDFMETLFRFFESLGLTFVAPEFGTSYDEKSHQLMLGNVSTLGEYENGLLSEALERWETSTNRPIVDVGQLGIVLADDLPFPVEFDTISIDPAVAYLTKH